MFSLQIRYLCQNITNVYTTCNSHATYQYMTATLLITIIDCITSSNKIYSKITPHMNQSNKYRSTVAQMAAR